MTVSDDEIERLCKSMKETAMRNTWQDSEKSKIKDVTKNVLVSWGVLKEVEGKVYPTNAYALLTGKMPQMPVIQWASSKERIVRILLIVGNLKALFRRKWKQHTSMFLKKLIWA